jgi:hypothetical protein
MSGSGQSRRSSHVRDMSALSPTAVELVLPSRKRRPPHRRPPPSHLRAGGGAVHSINSGLAPIAKGRCNT